MLKIDAGNAKEKNEMVNRLVHNPLGGDEEEARILMNRVDPEVVEVDEAPMVKQQEADLLVRAPRGGDE